MTTVPFFDLKEQNKKLRREYETAFRRMLAGADFILGQEVSSFEKEFAEFTGTRFAVGVNSGLDALSLALRVLNIGPGDEVILPANSFIATALAVTSVGAVPVLADVDPRYLLLNVESVKKVLTPKTKAVIPVHLYGQPVPMRPLGDFCRKHQLFLVEDACQAHGAAIGKKRCGSFGELGCFSFYPGKNLGAFGDGGMITTDNPSYYQKLLLLRNYGSVVKYQHEVAGFNTRLDSLQAAFLRIKLRRLEKWNQSRQILSRRYEANLKNLSGISILRSRRGYFSANHLYIVLTEHRDALRDFFSKKGIGAGIHYPVPIHLQGAYKHLGQKTGSFPVSEQASKKVLSLPIYPEMSLKAVDQVSREVRNFLKER